jgi:hypothetical protein
MIERLLRLASPPIAMGRGSMLVKKWSDERAALVNIGLPDTPDDARSLAEALLRSRSLLKSRRG